MGPPLACATTFRRALPSVNSNCEHRFSSSVHTGHQGPLACGFARHGSTASDRIAHMITDSALERQHIKLLLHVARRYYEDGATQQDIAGEIQFSRPTVSRLLAEAQRRGVVRITISHPLERVLDLEEALRHRFQLREVRVALVPPTSDPSSGVGPTAGDMVVSHLRQDSTIAVSNGRSVAATVRNIPRKAWSRSVAVQIVGSMGGGGTDDVDGPPVCRELADRLGGVARTLPVPLVVRSAETAALLRQEDVTVTNLQLARRADLVLTGVGAVDFNGVSGQLLQPFIDEALGDEIRRSGAVGHVCGHHFDQRGHHVVTSLCERTIGMGFDEFDQIPLRLAVAWGSEKVAALRALLSTPHINLFCTDEATARMLMEMP